ncbi:MAG: ABC transporter ATP-binding protein [Clostridia bacterium]|nr:ABC transporter ATP-binding protein [Clostridia bacterium]
MAEIAISCRNLKKTFVLSRKQQKIERSRNKYKVAVNGLSFDAYEGEIFGLLGANGAGKTTTLRIISTLIKADEGCVEVLGRNLKNEPDFVRSNIGFLTSELKLEDYFTPNYLFDYFAELHGVDKDTAEKRKRNLFGKFGIDKFAEVKVADLSSGMKQKVSLTIALVHDPKIIIFDEPTNGLDVITARTVTDFLTELKNEGKTIIISTHIFSLAERLCDRVGIIIEGRMTKCAPLAELVGESCLEDVFFEVYSKEATEK